MTSPERLQELASAAEPRAGLTEHFFLNPGPGVTEVLLIRHAQILGGLVGEDDELTEIGREQAELLGTFLSRRPLTAVYAAPSLRARQTAEALARQHGLDVPVLDGLRDIDTSLSLPAHRPMREALAETFGAEAVEAMLERMTRERSFDAMLPHVEGSAALRGRAIEAVNEAIARHEGGRIALVTHAPTVMAYVAAILDCPHDFTFYPSLTSMTVILARQEKRVLHALNWRPHLEG